MTQLIEIPEAIRKDLESFPGILYFPLLFPLLGLPSVSAAYRRYERGTLGVRVHDFGGRIGVLKHDLAIFLTNGEPQSQDELKRREPRNLHGRKGKPGRKSNQSKGLRGGGV